MNQYDGIPQQGFAMDPLDGYPALKCWSQHNGYAFVGFACWFVFSCALNLATGAVCDYFLHSADQDHMLAMSLSTLLNAAIVIVYAAVFYQSYFTANPMLRQSSDITFANFLVGGIVFGWLWTNNLHNSHLRKCPDKGVSYIVAIVLYSICAFLQLVVLAMLFFAFAIAYA